MKKFRSVVVLKCADEFTGGDGDNALIMDGLYTFETKRSHATTNRRPTEVA